MAHIRKATADDLVRIAEIQVFNYRLYFYPIFKSDQFYFDELQVPDVARLRQADLDHLLVYDDGVVKGFVQVDGTEVRRLFVEPVLHNLGIGEQLLDHVVTAYGADHLWALQKNERALRFYARHGFVPTGERMIEEGTTEYLVLLRRQAGEA